MPLFSIITINRNNERGLELTIASVGAQTFKDYEYIVIDGASTDASVEIIKKNKSTIAHWISEPDSGIYNAMNKGLALASGQYIHFLNSGDVFSNESSLDIFSGNLNGADFVYSDVFLFGGKDERVKIHPEKLFTRYLLTDMICHQAIMAKREVFLGSGKFNELYQIYGDYDWMLNAIVRKKLHTRHIPEVLVNYEEMGVSTSTSKAAQRSEKDAIQTKYFNPVLLFFFRAYRKWNDTRASQ